MTERKVTGRYRLLEPIGEGGMGIVWRAHDELLDRIVAVKEVRYRGVDESARADLNRRTIREARTAGRLDHPSVVIVHDVVEEEGRPWIVMQLVRSRSLGAVIREDGPLSPGQVASVGLHVLSALRAAHASGVLHRDVKPENVLLAHDGRVVLTDFGIAAMTHETAITRTGGMVGTPAFLPPERLHGLAATPLSDLWSLGATLYAALEGRPPFERSTAAATMQAVLHGEPSPMTHTGPLSVVILGLMSRDPGARMDPEQAEALLNRVSSGQASGPGNQASRHRSLLDADGPTAQSPDHGFASRPTPSSRPGAEAHRSEPPYESRSPYAGGPSHPAPPSGAASAWRLRHSPGDPGRNGSAEPGRPAYRGDAAEPGRPHQSGPAGPGRPAYLGQQAYQGGPADPGRPAYRGRAAEPGRPDHQDGPAGSGQPAYRSNPAQSPYQGGPPYSEPSPYGGEPSYRGAPTHSGQPPHGAEPSYPGSRSHRGLPTGTVIGFLRRRPPVERIAILIGVPALVAVVGVGIWLLTGGPDDTPSQGDRPVSTATFPDDLGDSTAEPSPRPSKTRRATPAPSGQAIPPGWKMHRDSMGFTVAIPRGWSARRFPDRDRVEFRDPDSDAFLWIESTEDSEKDPVRHWQKVEKAGTAKNLWPGYERIRITLLTYRGVAAADWEFLYLKKGVRTHVLDRGFHTASETPYAIYWESPDSEWDPAFFDTFTATFKPKS
ncbi:Serine/threonine protein kinase [Streptosporangium subroseum]|uniref:non-specific serine/threonine protein kinase n=1 Tax=Streptosporangium subroseum TaxID=106412 RepID=A0A239BV81_9ACTN|nr:serine/threonine-protein kinase [Streptosporangium subroseum]SNS11820.1 Serine/threonine protein kinase [Streptosporangium subroseum]